MLIIEINALENGAHRNQESPFILEAPSGWIEVPKELEEEAMSYLPFIVLDIDENGALIGVSQGEVPEIEPEQEETKTIEDVIYDELAMAYTEGVNSIDE